MCTGRKQRYEQRDQEPGSRGGHLSTVGKTLQSLLWAKSVWPKPRDQFEWGGGFFWGQKAELGRPDLGPHPPPRRSDRL